MTTSLARRSSPRRPLAIAPLGPQRLSDRAFDACAYILACGWPREPLPAPTLALYRALLAHLPDDLALQATTRAAATATFLPRPAEILARAHEILAERGEGPPTVEQAWHSVTLALRRGPAASLHPLTREALDHLGGLPAVSQATYQELAHLQRRFETAYRTLAGRHYLSLAGLAEQIAGDADEHP